MEKEHLPRLCLESLWGLKYSVGKFFMKQSLGKMPKVNNPGTKARVLICEKQLKLKELWMIHPGRVVLRVPVRVAATFMEVPDSQTFCSV